MKMCENKWTGLQIRHFVKCWFDGPKMAVHVSMILGKLATYASKNKNIPSFSGSLEIYTN